jgi:hypothetical protein
MYRGENTPEKIGISYNNSYKTIYILLGIGLTTYLCVDIYTQGLIFINLHHLWDYLFTNNNTHSDLDSDLSSSSSAPSPSASSSSSSSGDSSRTVTPSNFNSGRASAPSDKAGTLIFDASPQQSVDSADSLAHSPTLGSENTTAPPFSVTSNRGRVAPSEIEEIIPVFTPRPIPEDSRFLELGRDQLLVVTPDNRLFLTDRSTSPLGSITYTRYELDRNNNFSRTEIFTTYPDNRFDLHNIPAQATTSETSNINVSSRASAPSPLREEVYNRFRFNIEQDSGDSLANIFDIFS